MSAIMFNQRLDTIIHGDNVAVMQTFPAEVVDLVVTSPPYDNLRHYGGLCWDFEALVVELYRVCKPGAVVVWIVNDQIADGDQSCTSFNQAIAFKSTGFKLWQTMIWNKSNPRPGDGRYRYHDAFEFMFILSKGKPNATNIIRDVPATAPGTIDRTNSDRRRDERRPSKIDEPWVRPEYSYRTNVWTTPTASTSGDDFALQHPAAFPESLASDHVLTWSNVGDVVLDPFCGSGTTCRVAKDNGRRFVGIDLNPEFVALSIARLAQNVLPFAD